MNSSVYSKLAVTNIKNNRKAYVPYILTAILTVMMFYIMDALFRSDSVGDGSLKIVLGYAVVVIAIFAVIFLFYTNSFLIKRRKKEIGMYNILGMGKQHIGRMLAVETLITAGISIVIGMLGGIIFGKLMYLVLLKMLHYNVNMKFEISFVSIQYTLILFLGIFLLTLLFNLLQIQLANPVELLQGGSRGEKEPKTKWLLTIFGLLTIGAGYYIALTTESPLAAIALFFGAVVLVILGTYALFTAGSIALLKILKKNKKFYYKTKHFTSVSGMIYRMKQNAVGLANICILSTIVLVMISSTISLYMGMGDVLKNRFPTEFAITNYEASPEGSQKIRDIVEEETKKNQVETIHQIEYRYGGMSAAKEGTHLSFDEEETFGMENFKEVYAIPLEDYNAMVGEENSLKENEMMIYTTGNAYGKDSMVIGSREYQVVKELKKLPIEAKGRSRVIEGYYMILPDVEQVQSLLDEAYAARTKSGETVRGASIYYTMRFDLKGTKSDGKAAMKAMSQRITEEVKPSLCESRELNKGSFYMLYGGLLFIGIYLGLLFLMATVLIIYYKQISEGYDDKARYQIMQKVGMSKREVKRSIRSQVLTVFFLPLVVAIIHIAVAFKVITKLLAVLRLVNVPLFLTCTILTVIIFAVFYVIVFALTAREYYKIVN